MKDKKTKTANKEKKIMNYLYFSLYKDESEECFIKYAVLLEDGAYEEKTEEFTSITKAVTRILTFLPERMHNDFSKDIEYNLETKNIEPEIGYDGYYSCAFVILDADSYTKSSQPTGKKTYIKAYMDAMNSYNKEYNEPGHKMPATFMREQFGYGYEKYFPTFARMKEIFFGKNTSFNKDSITSIKYGGEKKKKYFITCAVEGQSVNIPFMNTIMNYCKHNRADMVILPMRGVSAADTEIGFPKLLMEHADSFSKEYVFSSLIRAMDLGHHPQNILPLTGLRRLAHNNYSLLLPHPKQHMDVVPINGHMPNIVHTTGSITNADNYAYTKNGKLAEKDHLFGGLVAEVDGDNVFHVRQIQSVNEDGSFYDLNKKYYQDRVEPAKASAIYAGDFHSGWIDPHAKKALFEQVSLLKPEYVFTGDVFDGNSISHHHLNNMKAQLERPEHTSSLEKELTHLAQELLEFHKKCPNTKFMAVRGNHDEWMDKYISECRFKDDRINHRLALELAIDLYDGKNPVEEYFRKRLQKNYEVVLKNTVWLDRNASFKIAGIELAQHGDVGFDGRFGTNYSLELTHGKCVVGHRHTPGIFRDVWVAGTMSVLDLPYKKSKITGWLHANISVYENGQRQMLINVKDKGWKM